MMRVVRRVMKPLLRRDGCGWTGCKERARYVVHTRALVKAGNEEAATIRLCRHHTAFYVGIWDQLAAVRVYEDGQLVGTWSPIGGWEYPS